MSVDRGRLPFYDKDTMPLKQPGTRAGIRIVPGGSAIREGAFVAKGVICNSPNVRGHRRVPWRRRARRFACAGRVVRADRATASTSAPRRRSAASSNRSAPCRSSSKTTCSSAVTPASTRARSSSRGRSSRRARFYRVDAPVHFAERHDHRARAGPSADRAAGAVGSCLARVPSPSAPDATGGCRWRRR